MHFHAVGVGNSTRIVRERSGASDAATASLFVRPPNPVISQKTSYSGGRTRKPKANMPAAKTSSFAVSAALDWGCMSIVSAQERSTPSRMKPR
jgi:hypothetical protein